MMPTSDKHDYDSAIADFTEAIRLDPKDARRVWRRAVKAYQRQGRLR
jgi:tetratricopeptide (TPR) repeat protein